MSSQAGQSGQASQYKHAPYPPVTWTIGGEGIAKLDIPITAVFLLLFIGSAVTHMTIFQINNRQGHNFKLSGLLFGFSMARIIACVLRIASICVPKNISLAIAAFVFLQAGVVIIFIINLVFAQRILRAVHRNSAWHPIFSIMYNSLYGLIILTIAMVIVVAVQSFYTLNANTHRIDHDIEVYGATCFAIISFLPIPMVILGYLFPRSGPLDKFGTGHHRVKLVVLLVATVLISFGACYRAAQQWLPEVPLTEPLPSRLGKGPFYVAYFTVEIITLYTYAIARVDHRFHVPDGAKGPGSYSAGRQQPGKIETKGVGNRMFSDAENVEDDRESDLEKGNKSPVLGSGEMSPNLLQAPMAAHSNFNRDSLNLEQNEQEMTGSVPEKLAHWSR